MSSHHHQPEADEVVVFKFVDCLRKWESASLPSILLIVIYSIQRVVPSYSRRGCCHCLSRGGGVDGEGLIVSEFRKDDLLSTRLNSSSISC